jgi:16S rRNA (guanine1516-N2)-methyltransferase
MSKLAVLLDNDQLKATALAEALKLPLLSPEQDLQGYPYVLSFGRQGLVLQQTGEAAAGPVLIDFGSSKAQHRRNQGGGELLVKALGGDKQQRPTVLDVTAGLGRDSFVMACWGYPVTMLERSPVIAALLDDGLQRARHNEDAELQAVIGNMTLHAVDARQYLTELDAGLCPDIIYLDPMFPPSKKSALVKKDMQAFHYVLGKQPDDADELLSLALHKARHRVVVKRPLKAACLGGKKPTHALKGKAVRFDVYGLKAFAK